MTKIGLIPGRMNPPHRGHRKLFRKSLTENDLTFVIIIEGKITGLNKMRNPLTFRQKKKIIKLIEPRVEIQQFPKKGSHRTPSADLPGIIVELLESIHTNETDFVFTVYSGSDRMELYTRQATTPAYIQKIKDELDEPDYNITINVVVIERDDSSDEESGISATKVREAIKNGKNRAAMTMMGITDKDFYEEIKASVLAGITKESTEKMINLILEKI